MLPHPLPLTVTAAIAGAHLDGGPPPAIVWVLPFAALLLAIAVLPLVAGHSWESNRNKAIVVAALALPTFLLLARTDPGALADAALDYASFLGFLGSLYVVSGGIRITGDIEATPLVNTGILLLGALLANAIGTTGASMLLVRPLLQINSERRRVTHTIVFFIFLVSNVGGLLTPLGDPPLLLGYLRGVPFAWTLTLWKPWLCAVTALLAIYAIVETALHRRETRAALQSEAMEYEPLRVAGLVNAPLLAAIVAAVALIPAPWREGVMVGAALASLALTPAGLRAAGGFGFGPIVEVAVLFAGIFITMVPALHILEARASDLGLSTPLHFYVATGALSAILDNAPTYLTLLSVAKGLHASAAPGVASIAIDGGAVPEPLLVAISLGAVFWGAATYIGNGPNFMVKAIAEQSGVKMPSFAGYLLWSCALLGPVLALVGVLFLA